jgi:hypothetical protein
MGLGSLELVGMVLGLLAVALLGLFLALLDLFRLYQHYQ